MDCKRFREVVFLFIDDEMGEELREPFHQHLECCPPCLHHATYAKKFIFLIRERCVRRAASAALRERILASLPHRSRGQRPR